MAFENIIKNAAKESMEGTRTGDKKEEVLAIQNYIKNAKKVFVPNKNNIKTQVINEILEKYGISKAKNLDINTNSADSHRFPCISKATMALDQSDADMIIGRGRLGIPGSGSMLVFMDNKGRILTAGFSPSHVVHKKSLEEAVRDETIMALKRIGLEES